MGYYLDTTRAERFAAEKIADLTISDVEVASKILGSTWEEYFGEREQQAIGANEATGLGRIIYTSLRLINAAIDEYHLTLGHYLEQRTEIFVERAAQVAKTIEAEKAFEAAREAGCSDSIKQARDLDNDSAIKLLTAAVMRRQTAEK